MPRILTLPDHRSTPDYRSIPLLLTGLLALLALSAHPAAASGDHPAPPGGPGGKPPADDLQSAYAGQQDVAATGLLPAEVEALEQGKGMAQALPAEVNGYPGPRHVLDAAAAGSFDLQPSQRQEVEGIYDRMHERAVAKGAEVLAAEAELARRFRHRHIDPPTLAELTGRIALLRGELRVIHLAAHLETEALLTPEQVAAYRTLRGYETHSGHHGRHHPG